MNNKILIIILIFCNTLVYSQDKYESSSALREGNYEYSAQYAFDGSLLTAWSEGRNGLGSHEWVQKELETPQLSDGIIIYPGFHRRRDLFVRNSIPKSVMVYINDDYIGSYDLRIERDTIIDSERIIPADHLLNYSPRILIFDKPINISKINITIGEIVKGMEWEDTLISEIELISTDYTGKYISQIDLLRKIRDKEFAFIDQNYKHTALNPFDDVYDKIHQSNHSRPNLSNKSYDSSNPIEMYFAQFYDLYINSIILGLNIDNQSYVIGQKSFHYGGSEWQEGFPIISILHKYLNFTELYSYGGAPGLETEFPEELTLTRPFWEPK